MKHSRELLDKFKKMYPGNVTHHGFGRDVKDEIILFIESAIADTLRYAADEVGQTECRCICQRKPDNAVASLNRLADEVEHILEIEP